MIACLTIPGLELKAALRRTPTLALRPAALAPEPQGEPLLGPVTVAAEAAGVRPGMRLGEALATRPSLALIEPDAAQAEPAWGGTLHALQEAGCAVAERLGPDGRRAWGLARGGTAARVRGRRPPALVAASLEFPEAVGNELTLRRALAGLVETALAQPERRDRFVRKVALAARLESGGSWRRALTLREPSADPDRIRVALSPRLAELPGPVAQLRLELVELTEPTGHQLELLAAGAEDRSRLP